MMQHYYLLTAAVVACLSSAITWYLVDPQTFVLYNYNRLVSNSKSSVSGTASGKTTFAFYKLSLQWPSSTCNSLNDKGERRMNCTGRVPEEFTIHGLWPQTIDDKKITPYDTDKSCTTFRPASEDIIPKLQPIERELRQLWPNLRNTKNDKLNKGFWQHEWKNHGKCSDYPTDPLGYFKDALNLRKDFDPVFGLIPGETYKLQDVAAKVGNHFANKIPEITCTKSSVNNKMILWEVRLCYNKQTYPKATAVQDCKKKFTGLCEKSKLNDLILIPKSTSV